MSSYNGLFGGEGGIEIVGRKGEVQRFLPHLLWVFFTASVHCWVPQIFCKRDDSVYNVGSSDLYEVGG